MMSKGRKGSMVLKTIGTVGVVQSRNLAMPVGERESLVDNLGIVRSISQSLYTYSTWSVRRTF
jgi:hypothetical protein